MEWRRRAGPLRNRQRANQLNGRKTSVKRYDGVTGDFIDNFVTPQNNGVDDLSPMVFTHTDPVTLEYSGRDVTL
jgi:hypothetical protein